MGLTETETVAGLTPAQKQDIIDNGYTLLPGLVPPARVAAALRVINASLGEGSDPAQLDTLRSQSWCPELTDHPAILDLLTGTAAWALAESAIGAGQLESVNHGQIAVRFPVTTEPGEVRPHLDGMYTPHNGVTKGEIANFTALVGVYLSDVPTDNAGNFTVWPGSHRRYAEYFGREGAESLLRGMPPVDIGDPVQTTPRAGDVVLSHYQIGHGVAPNVSPHIRYAIYFRLTRVGHSAVKFDVMSDLWREWDGLRELLS
jgi:hypothetical protein